MTDPIPPLDYVQLNRELDRTKTKTFLNKNAGFLGPLMCTMEFSWDDTIPTACTNGLYVKWNPHFFLRCSIPGRQFVLVHELWHPGLLHMLRRGDRHPVIWNIAADYSINNMLDHEGYSMSEADLDGVRVCLDHKYDGWLTEAIYDDLIANAIQIPGDFFSDMIEPSKTDQPIIVNNVVAATMAAKAAGGNKAGNLPGELTSILKQFLEPKLPWDQLLDRFFNSIGGEDYTWKRPNRRYADMYLPSRSETHEGLDHIVDFLDVSGSVLDPQVIRFNSEIRHIKEKYNPKLLTLVLFDTKIQKVIRFTDEDPFEQLVVVGRGGTSLKCVREFLIQEKPDAAVIFSDLDCKPMEKLPINIPLIWVAIDNHRARVNEGKLVHVKD